MNQKERKKLHEFPGEKLKEAIRKEFGDNIKVDTTYNLFSNEIVTTIHSVTPIKVNLLKQVRKFIDAFEQGCLAMIDSLENL